MPLSENERIIERDSRTIKLVVTLALLALVVVGTYRYLDSINFFAPSVDLGALQARAAREQPVGGGEEETVTFLRALGFKDRNIHIRRYSAKDTRRGETVRIEAWIPQRVRFYLPSQIKATCRFFSGSRLERCDIDLAGSYLPHQSEFTDDVTPSPIPK